MTASRPDWTAIVTSRGRVTIPRAVRTLLGISPGVTICFELKRDGEVAVRVSSLEPVRAQHPQSRFARLRGIATVKMRTDEILALTRGA
jgi:AbrB family looped-hinge helix DNA binding protein